MASKFIGRDYSTLRTEIIEFLRKKLPRDWDYQNLADPVVIFAESLARMGDELHYTIDELRRECDVATAKRASSIYSYAMREGYRMMLPRAARGILSINTTPEQDGLLHLKLKKFDEIVVNPAGESLYVVDDSIDADLHAPINPGYVQSLRQYYDASNDTYDKEKLSVYQAYIEDTYNKTQRVNVVLGEKGEFTFTYNDINKDSTVELPDPMIDRTLIRLTYTNSKLQEKNEWAPLTLVDDVISSGYNFKSYTLTPKFIGGAITLNIEFPTNYGDIFENDFSTKFKFEYIKIKNTKIEPLTIYQDNAEAVDFGVEGITVVKGHEEDQEILDNGLQYRVNFGNGIRGYAEYESPQVTRENYKRFVQNYSALLTKDDYSSYIKSTYTDHCIVYDHGDMYKNPPVLPEDADLIPRAVYIITDAPYKDREIIWNDLKERSSRSDCIVTQPVGKDPYMIVIKADCYLVGTSIASVAKAIESELLNYYSGSMGERIPKISMINYLTHKASDKVIKMDSLIVRDTTYGYLDTTFNKVNQLSNDEIDRLFDAIKNGNVNYKSELTDDTQTNDDYQYYLRGTLYVHETLDDDKDNIIGQTVYTKDELDRANEESENEIECTKSYYLKYPKITHAVYNETINAAEYQPVAEFANFPSSYPKIYNMLSSSDDDIIEDFDTLVLHQRAYGEFDSESWDYADKDIYKESVAGDPPTTELWIAFYYEVDEVSGKVQVYIPAYDTTYNSESTINPDDFKNLTANDDSDKKIYAEPDITSTSYTFTAGTKLFDTDDTDETHIPYLKEVNTYKVSVELDPNYVKHHYMVPVLNKVVVLIKAVNTKV